MALPKLPSNFKYKALFYCRFFVAIPKPSTPDDTLPSPKLDPRWTLVSETTELWGLEGMLPVFNTKRGRGVC